MAELIIRAIEQGGYVGIFLLMALENIVPPVPSEVIMGVGGVLVHRGSMDFWPLLLIGTAGTLAGNWFWFWLGEHWARHRLEPFVERWGRWLTMEWEDVERAQHYFQKHGHWVVFFMRVSPFLRTIISLPAGLARMPKWKFALFTFAGSLGWNALLIKGGEWLGHWLADSQEVLSYIIIGIFAVLLVAYLWRVARWKPRAER